MSPRCRFSVQSHLALFPFKRQFVQLSCDLLLSVAAVPSRPQPQSSGSRRRNRVGRKVHVISSRLSLLLFRGSKFSLPLSALPMQKQLRSILALPLYTPATANCLPVLTHQQPRLALSLLSFDNLALASTLTFSLSNTWLAPTKQSAALATFGDCT